MGIDFKKSNEQGKFVDLMMHLAPASVAIFLFQAIAIQIYYNNPLSISKTNFFIWCTSQAIGSFTLGVISDKYSRKKAFIITQAFGISAVMLMLWQGYSNLLVILLIGLTFSPSSIVRATLIDNFPKESKVKLIGISFIAVFLPWCFFFKLIGIDPNAFLKTIIALLSSNLLFTIFYFKDKRNLQEIPQQKTIFIKKSKKKAMLTLLSLLAGQSVFFLSDTFFEGYANSAPYFTTLGIGALLGAIVSIFYRNLPHISFLTVCYGIGFILSLLSVISLSLLSTQEMSLTSQILLFSILGGLYLPFVYDVILSSVSANFRGTTCGILEVVISISSFIGLGIILIFQPNQKNILYMVVSLFLVAAISQKQSEDY